MRFAMSNTPKRHHYVPKFILRNFADNNGKLHCFDKESDRIYEASPRDVFVKKHGYTQQSADGSRSAPVETQLMELEGRASRVTRRIIASARSGCGLGLAAPERDTWLEVLASQAARLPKVQASLQETDFASVVDNVERVFGPLSPEVRAYVQEYTKDPQAIRRATLGAIIHAPEGPNILMPILRGKAIGAVVLKAHTEDFVIGNNPILYISSPAGRTDLRAPGVTLLYPVSWDVGVVWGLQTWERDLTFADSQDVRLFNDLSFGQSEIIAGRSEKLVRSVAARNS